MDINPGTLMGPHDCPDLQPDRLETAAAATIPVDILGAFAVARTPRTFVDLFAGCGGFSLGLMQAGWSGLFAVERDPHAFATVKHNLLSDKPGYTYAWPEWFPRKPTTVEALLETYRANLEGMRGQVGLLVGGPPCQGFSFAGQRKIDDIRNRLAEHYLEVVSLVQPTYVLLENVKGIEVTLGATAHKKTGSTDPLPRPAAAWIREGMEGLGYKVWTGRIRARDFGVPQTRERFILMGIRVDALPSGYVPADPLAAGGGLASLRAPFLTSKGLPTDKPVTVRQALSDLLTVGRELRECEESPGFKELVYREPRGRRTRYQKLMRNGSKVGEAPNSLRLVNHREKTIARFTHMLKECRRGVGLSQREIKQLGLNKHAIVVLDGNQPSHTLTTLPDDYLHFEEPRILTVRENARLQSFPDWFAFKGKYTTGAKLRTREAPRYTQVGNAVPPLVAEVLGMAIDHLDTRILEARMTGLAPPPPEVPVFTDQSGSGLTQHDEAIAA